MKDDNIRFAARKYALYDQTASDCTQEIADVYRKIQVVYGPLAGAAVANATEDAHLEYASGADCGLRDDLLTGIREREAYKWYAMIKSGKKSAAEIALTSYSSVSTIEDSVRQVEDYIINLSIEGEEDVGTEAS